MQNIFLILQGIRHEAYLLYLRDFRGVLEVGWKSGVSEK
jgi:hypothetical protein